MEEKNSIVDDCNMNAAKKVLVTYATRAGSTQGVAMAIRDRLCANGFHVHLVNAKEKITDISAYQFVVIGSAIRVGRWLPEASKFVEKNQEMLKKKTLAYFLVCMQLKDDTPENRKIAADYLKAERNMVMPLSEAYFAGKSDFSKLSFFSRIMGKFAKMPEGDFRNWDAINKWADELSLKFKLIN